MDNQHRMDDSSHTDQSFGKYEESTNSEMSLKEFILRLQEWLKYLISKWLIIVIAGILGGVSGLVYAYYQKPVYIAELTFVVEGGKQGGSGAYGNLASQLGINIGGASGIGVFEGNNLLSLMKSRTMIEKALMTTIDSKGEKKTLAELYIDINGLREKWAEQKSKAVNIHFLPGTDPVKFTVEQSSLMRGFHSEIISKNLVVDNVDKKTSIIAVRVNSVDELFSKYFADALMKEVSEFYVETKTKKLVDNLSVLQYQADSVKRAFNAAINGAAYSTDANPNPNPSRQTLRVPFQLRQMDAQISQAMLAQLIQNVEVAKMSLMTETPFIQMIDRPVLPLPRSAYSKFTGIRLGIILGVMIAVCLLLAKRIWEQLMAY
jgi:uncharacterized protein involved in exopolysaccharide biosynthesis